MTVTVAAELRSLTEDATIQDYLRYAALNNAGLKAAFNRWKAALERIPQAKSLSDPRFNYAYFIEEVETRVGPQRQKFGLSQTFPWFGTLSLRADAATEAAAAMQALYEKEKLRLFVRVTAAYHEYWYLGREIAVTREHGRLVTDMERVARTRFKTGATPHSDVIQAQVELGKLDDRLHSLESLREPLVAGLNAAMSRPTDLTLPWPRSLAETTVHFSDEQAVQWLVDGNPDLLRLDHLTGQAEVGVGLAKRSAYPDITLGVDYLDTGDALNANVVDSGKDPVVAMVSLSLPLWYGKHRAATRESRWREAAAQADRVDTEKRLRADLTLALYHFKDADRKIKLYRDTLVPKAEQSVEVARQGFEAGKTSFLALVDAQRLLLEFQLAHERAQADRGTRLAEIEMLVGKEITAEGEMEK